MGYTISLYKTGGHNYRDSKLYDNDLIGSTGYNFPLNLPSGSIRLWTNAPVHVPSDVAYILINVDGGALDFIVKVTSFEYKDDKIVVYNYDMDLIKTFFLNYRSWITTSHAFITKTTDITHRTGTVYSGAPMSGRQTIEHIVGNTLGSTGTHFFVVVLNGQGAFAHYQSNDMNSFMVTNAQGVLRIFNELATSEHSGELLACIDKIYALPISAEDFTGYTPGGAKIDSFDVGVLIDGLSGGFFHKAFGTYPMTEGWHVSGCDLNLGDDFEYEGYRPPLAHYRAQIPFIGWIDLDDWAAFNFNSLGTIPRLSVQYELDLHLGRIRGRLSGSRQLTEWVDLPRIPLIASNIGVDFAQTKVAMISSVFDATKSAIASTSSGIVGAATGDYGTAFSSGLSLVNQAVGLMQKNAQFDLDLQKSRNATSFMTQPSVDHDDVFQIDMIRDLPLCNHKGYGNTFGWYCGKFATDTTFEFEESHKYWIDLTGVYVPDIMGQGDAIRSEIERDYIIW